VRRFITWLGEPSQLRRWAIALTIAAAVAMGILVAPDPSDEPPLACTLAHHDISAYIDEVGFLERNTGDIDFEGPLIDKYERRFRRHHATCYEWINSR
jgi:hypothetical protein